MNILVKSVSFYLERSQRYGVLKNVQLFGSPCIYNQGTIGAQIYGKNLSFQRRLYLINLDKPEAVALALY